MLFKRDLIPKIIRGEKTMTSRLVKKYEILDKIIYDTDTICSHFGSKIKWQVGRDYAVQEGRGKSCVIYCSQCNQSIERFRITTSNLEFLGCKCLKKSSQEILLPKMQHNVPDFWKPLRFIIKSIKKKRLLETTEEEAKKEGFKNKKEFFEYFSAIYKTKINIVKKNKRTKKTYDINIDIPKTDKYLFIENPKIFQLEFKVMK